MSYSKSTARRDFDQEIDEIKSTLVTAFEENTFPARVNEYVLASSIFLTSARIETYIQDSFDSIASAISNSSKTASTLPNELRACLFLTDNSLVQTWRNHVAQANEPQLVDALSRFFTTPYSHLSVPTSPIPPISGRMIYTTKKYPSPDNIRLIYLRLGIDKIFQKTSALMEMNSENILTSFNDKRTAIAHYGTITGVSHVDILNELERLKEFVGALDRVAYEMVSSSFGHITWESRVA